MTTYKMLHTADSEWPTPFKWSLTAIKTPELGPTALLVALVLGMTAKRSAWPSILVDPSAIAARTELPVPVVDAVVDGLVARAFLIHTGVRDRQLRRTYIASVPAESN